MKFVHFHSTKSSGVYPVKEQCTLTKVTIIIGYYHANVMSVCLSCLITKKFRGTMHIYRGWLTNYARIWHWPDYPPTPPTPPPPPPHPTPRQNSHHLTDDIFICIFMNEYIWISIKISLKYVPEGTVNNNQALVQIMAWRRPGDKLLSEPMMVMLPTHIWVTRPEWVNNPPHWQAKTWNATNLCIIVELPILFASWNLKNQLVRSLCDKIALKKLQ